MRENFKNIFYNIVTLNLSIYNSLSFYYLIDFSFFSKGFKNFIY